MWGQSKNEKKVTDERINQEKNARFFGGDNEVWPLRSDIPSKK